MDVITSIAFQYNGYTAWQDNIDIYMAHTSKTKFDNDTDWLSHDLLTKVYSGPISVQAHEQWVTIALDQPYFYNNTDNLVVAVDENKPTFHGPEDHFLCTKSDVMTGLFYTQDDYSSIDPTPIVVNLQILRKRFWG